MCCIVDFMVICALFRLFFKEWKSLNCVVFFYSGIVVVYNSDCGEG